MEEKDNIVDVESEVIEEKKVDNTGNSKYQLLVFWELLLLPYLVFYVLY